MSWRGEIKALQARVADLQTQLAEREAELEPWRALGGSLTVQCSNCAKHKRIDLSPRALRERAAEIESDIEFNARMADLLSPQAEFERAAALSEMREEAAAKAHRRERELRAEHLYDRDETRQRLAQGPGQPKE